MARTTTIDEPTLEYLKAYVADRGYAPSMREVAVAMGLASASGAKKVLERLEAAGHLTLTPGISRGIRLR